jgi:hypothetical protein
MSLIGMNKNAFIKLLSDFSSISRIKRANTASKPPNLPIVLILRFIFCDQIGQKNLCLLFGHQHDLKVSSIDLPSEGSGKPDNMEIVRNESQDAEEGVHEIQLNMEQHFKIKSGGTHGSKRNVGRGSEDVLDEGVVDLPLAGGRDAWALCDLDDVKVNQSNVHRNPPVTGEIGDGENSLLKRVIGSVDGEIPQGVVHMWKDLQ